MEVDQSVLVEPHVACALPVGHVAIVVFVVVVVVMVVVLVVFASSVVFPAIPQDA